MHVVDPVVHDCRGDVFARHPLSPGGRNIQVQLGLSTILAGVFLFRSKHYILSPMAYFEPAHELTFSDLPGTIGVGKADQSDLSVA